MTKLYLVRHGETYDNLNRIMQGQTQGELTEKGIQQARELAEKLRLEPIDAFVSSDLRRAVDTCKLIIGQRKMAVTPTILLRERDWGDFTGRYIPDLQGEQWPDNVETLERLAARAANFLTWVKVSWPHKTVLAVGHGIINKAIQSVYFNRPMNQVLRMENGEMRVLML